MKDKLFFTSDTHFGHKNIIKYSNRPFKDVSEMNHAMIKNINEKVPHDGILYHLGDFGFLPADELMNIIDQINCKIIFLDGNHDKEMSSAKVREKLSSISLFPSRKRNKVAEGIVQSVVPGVEILIKDSDAPRGEQLIYLCHYPSLTWNKAHHGSWCLHGHCHGSMRYPFPAKIMDVGVDPCGFFPISYAEVKERMNKIIPQSLDHHSGD